MISAYPICWPAAWPRTPAAKRERARFKTTFHGAVGGIREQVRMFGGTDLVISTNVGLRKDGQPRADQRPDRDDPAVAVYFKLAGDERCIPCDRWDTVAANLQAVHLTIEALRGIDRWATGAMMRAAFTGFAALPPGAAVAAGEAWWTVLGVEPTATLDQARAAYRERIRSAHPDKGGSDAETKRLNAAMEAAEKQIGR